MVSPTSKPSERKLAEFVPLKPTEEMLLESCRIGKPAIIIPAKQSEQATEKNTVRASFLRFLALGGDEYAPVHEKGVQLWNAWVEGDLDLESAFLPHNLGLGNCHLSAIVLRYSKVHGSVSFHKSHINGLNAERMVCSSNFFLKKCTTAGTVRLFGAQIGGDLECDGSEFNGMDHEALNCQQAVIKGNICLKEQFTALGTVNLMDVKIGGSLICRNALFIGNYSDREDDTTAIIGARAVINGGVYLDGKFIAHGGVRFSAAQIDSELICDGGFFNGKGDEALICEQAVIKGRVGLREFIAIGTVNLNEAEIGGTLTCSISSINAENRYELAKNDMIEAKILSFHDFLQNMRCMSLIATKVGNVDIHINSCSWSGDIGLDGFVYDRLTGKTPTDATSLLAWIDKQSASHAGRDGNGKNFRPQPWRQLQKVLHEMGHVEDARQVAIAFQERLRTANLIGQVPKNWCTFRNSSPYFYCLFGVLILLSLFKGYYSTVCLSLIGLIVTLLCGRWIYRKICRGLHWWFRELIGYGYRPLRLLNIMLIVWFACGAFYWYAALYGNNGYGVFAPSNPLVFQNCDYDVCKADKEMAKAELSKPVNGVLPPTQGAGSWYLCKKLREEYTGFSPLAYSLDLILPLVDLQQERDWAPMIPTPKNTWDEELAAHSLNHITRFMIWFEILFGWMSSLLLVAVVSGLTERRQE